MDNVTSNFEINPKVLSQVTVDDFLYLEEIVNILDDLNFKFDPENKVITIEADTIKAQFMLFYLMIEDKIKKEFYYFDECEPNGFWYKWIIQQNLK